MKLLCNLFGHRWRYNFGWMPSKRKCQRCLRYEEMSLQKGKCPIKEPDEYMLWKKAEYDPKKTEL